MAIKIELSYVLKKALWIRSAKKKSIVPNYKIQMVYYFSFSGTIYLFFSSPLSNVPSLLTELI